MLNFLSPEWLGQPCPNHQKSKPVPVKIRLKYRFNQKNCIWLLQNATMILFRGPQLQGRTAELPVLQRKLIKHDFWLWSHMSRQISPQESHTEREASSNYGKVVEALALLLGICAWYPPKKQQAVGNLQPSLPLRLKPVQASRTAKRGRLSKLLTWSFMRRAEWYEAAVQRWPLDNSPHSVHHQPGCTECDENVNLTRFGNLCSFTLAAIIKQQR